MNPTRLALVTCLLATAAVAQAANPSFNCAKASNSVEKLICNDAELAKLDNSLSSLYHTLMKNTSAAEQKTAQDRAAGLGQGARRLLEERRYARLRGQRVPVPDRPVEGPLTGRTGLIEFFRQNSSDPTFSGPPAPDFSSRPEPETTRLMMKNDATNGGMACPPTRGRGMTRRLMPSLLLAAALAGGAEAGTVVTVPTDLNPGDQYRLVFVTNGTRDAQSTDIADYNAFVTNQANQSTELQALGVDWFVIGSTSTVSARDNTGTDGSGGVPIYLPVGGDHRIADDYNDLWDGTIGHPLNIDQFGDEVPDTGSTTGAQSDGSIDAAYPIGTNASDQTRNGFTFLTNKSWVNATVALSSFSQRFYAISDLLTVPGAAVCDGTTAVGSEAKLNDAIAAFNAETVTPCVHTIKLTADIALDESTTPIENVIGGVSLVIDGNGYTVDGQDGDNVQGFDGMQPFAIESGTVVSMNDLTVTRGKPVGSGALQRGGGIRNDGSLTLTRCTVAGNETDSRGGGIANRGTLVIDSSTISGNASGAGQGGGIYSEGGSVTITNSTISGNEADSGGVNDVGGGIFASGSLTLDSVTITDNFSEAGSGIYVDTANGDLTIGNTILSDNSPLGFDCYFDASGSGSVQDQGYNLFVGTNGCGFNDGVDNNILSQAFLEPLADNGGPTQTHAPQITSPVIDAGSTGLTVDQRGSARPGGPADDIGAYESLGCGDSPWSVTNQAELSAAIECFNTKTAAGTYTISIDQGFPATVSTAAIDNPTSGVELVIEGNGNSADWNGNLISGVRPFLIEADTTVTINDFFIGNGNVQGTERGGGIRNLGNLTINRCSVAGNRSEIAGGGISNLGVMAINDSTIFANVVDAGSEAGVGGGINNEGTLTIANSTISGNTSSDDGGGIATTGPLLSLDSVTVANNQASGAVGGAEGAGVMVFTSGGAMTATNSILAGNSGAEDCYKSAFAGVTDDGNNLVQTQDGCGFTDGVNGAIVGQDPLLGALRDNGGPTRTHALQTGSPAIDAGDTDLTTDQRGEPRPGGPADDIGAFEEEQLGTITVVRETAVPDPTDVDYSIAGGALAAPIDFQLDTSLEDLDGIWFSKSFPLAAGAYSITEIPPVGFTGSVAIECEDENGPLGRFTGDTANVSLVAYQHITCTFTDMSSLPSTPSCAILGAERVAIGARSSFAGDSHDLCSNGVLETGAGVSVDTSLLAIGSMDLGSRTTVAKNAYSNGDLSIGARGTIGFGDDLADRDVITGGDLSLKSGTQVEGGCEYAGSLSVANRAGCGTEIQSSAPPFMKPFELPDCTVTPPTAGAPDIDTAARSTVYYDTPLMPGDYGDVSFGARNRVALEAGEYHFQSLDFGVNTEVEIRGAVTVHVVDALSFRSGVQEVLVGVQPNEIVYLVNGVSTDDPEHGSGARTVLFGTFCGLDSTISFGSGSELTGAVIGKEVQFGAGVDFTADPAPMLDPN